MGEDFVPATYVTAPQINVASGVALAIALLNKVPAKAGDGARAAARELRAATRAVQAQWAKEKPRKKADQRPFDNAADVSWGALIDRLGAQAALPRERHPLAEKADGLLDVLALRDRTWLQLKYPEQWAEAQRRLDRVQAQGLRGALDAAAGEGFLAEVEFAHKAYGDALGITAQHDEVDDNVAMVGPLHALADALAEYGLQVSALYRKADAEGRREVKKALRPIDEHRARYARGGAAAAEAGASEPVTPTTPVPEAG